jgi:hypothetical protein
LDKECFENYHARVTKDQEQDNIKMFLHQEKKHLPVHSISNHVACQASTTLLRSVQAIRPSTIELGISMPGLQLHQHHVPEMHEIHDLDGDRIVLFQVIKGKG